MRENPYFYEKEADDVNYIYFSKYVVDKENSTFMLPHFHDSVEFVFMLEGKNRIRIGSEEKLLKGGEIAFARPFEPHYYMPQINSRYYVLLISSGYLNSGTDFSKDVFPAFMSDNGSFKMINEFLDCAYKNWSIANERFKRGFSEMIMGLMEQIYEKVSVRDKKATKAFVEILKFINENFKSDISLKKLSKRFGYTQNYLSELFNEFTGMNLREYINRRRINEFYRIKGEEGGTADCRIARICGFNSPNTFYRALKKYSK